MIDYTYTINEEGTDLEVAVRPKKPQFGNWYDDEDLTLTEIIVGNDIYDEMERNDFIIRV